MGKYSHKENAENENKVGLAILGSTGSIGTQTLDIVRLFPDKLKVFALSAQQNVDLLVKQALEFMPACVVIGEEGKYQEVKERLQTTGIEICIGAGGLKRAATMEAVDTVVAAVVGFAGLDSVMAGIQAGKVIALANKETLVAGGEFVNRQLKTYKGTLIPVDSEHSAIFQCLVGEAKESIETLLLTASGGPFRTRDQASFASITRQEALNHPNWSMGAKITIDSATMMNKGLEVIEARWMFEIPPERIEVLVHPQSIIHSMVIFADGSTKAQLGVPDMRVPIQYAISYPERWIAPHPRISWSNTSSLDFEIPDKNKFPCLQLAFEALYQGGLSPAVLNAANEAAVDLFLRDRVRFVDIPIIIEDALGRFGTHMNPSMEALVEIHQRVERHVKELYSPRAN